MCSCGDRGCEELLAVARERPKEWEKLIDKLAVDIMSRDHSRALLLQAIYRDIATKQDLEKLRQELREEMREMEQRLNQRIDRLEERVRELEVKVSSLDERIAVQTKWIQILVVSLWLPLLAILLKLLGAY